MPKERFQFDMSAAKDKKRRRRNRQGMSGAVETSTRICEHPSCNRVGKYRAPKAPGGTGEFHWFCRQHVRQYNSQWDFFKISEGESTDDPTDSGDGQSPEERREQREQLAWQRLGIKDPFEILGESGTRSGHAHVASARLSRNERRALNILDAKDGWGKKELRRQYRSLVKDLHPDMNGGDRSEEDRLKEVVWAWDQLKASSNIKP